MKSAGKGNRRRSTQRKLETENGKRRCLKSNALHYKTGNTATGQKEREEGRKEGKTTQTHTTRDQDD